MAMTPKGRRARQPERSSCPGRDDGGMRTCDSPLLAAPSEVRTGPPTAGVGALGARQGRQGAVPTAAATGRRTR